jgi:hypothetical protein
MAKRKWWTPAGLVVEDEDTKKYWTPAGLVKNDNAATATAPGVGYVFGSQVFG